MTIDIRSGSDGASRFMSGLTLNRERDGAPATSGVAAVQETALVVRPKDSATSIVLAKDSGSSERVQMLAIAAEHPEAAASMTMILQADAIERRQKAATRLGSGGLLSLGLGALICFSPTAPMLPVLAFLIGGLSLLGSSAVLASGRDITVEGFLKLLKGSAVPLLSQAKQPAEEPKKS